MRSERVARQVVPWAPALLALLALVLGSATAAVAGDDPAAGAGEPVLGLGWQEGVTLHWRFAGPWYVEGAAGPDDLLIESRSTEWDTAVLPEDSGRPETDADDKREMGWVRLGFGRRIWRHAELDLQLVTGLRYRWENTQERQNWWDPDADDYWRRATQLSEDSWDFFLAARPVWRVHRRVSLGFDLGFAFSWSHSYQRTVTVRPGPDGEENIVDNLRGKQRSFETWGGWDGLAALHFMFWF